MAKHIVSPANLSENIWQRLRKKVGRSLLQEAHLQTAWYEVLDAFTLPIAREYASAQWKHLKRSLRRIERAQKALYDQGNLTKRQLERRIQLRNNDSIRESARQVIVSQLESNELDAGASTMACLLHTAADEPDLAHTMLEGKVMPLVEVLQELTRFGCQHEYEIVTRKPLSARLWGMEDGLEDDVPFKI